MIAAQALHDAEGRIQAAGLDPADALALARYAATEPQFLDLVERRLRGAPLGLLLGRAMFLGVELETSPDALAPREETEILGRTALDLLRGELGDVAAPRIIDVCCGVGNLACAIAVHVPQATIVALDLTDGAVAMARRNVERLGLADRVEVLQGDLLGPLEGRGWEGGVDLIVCNPPYISTGRLAKDRATLLEHEPREAFDAGPYGLAIHQRIVREAAPFLRPGGWLAVEFGEAQEKQVGILFRRAETYEEVGFATDSRGAPRVCKARRRA